MRTYTIGGEILKALILFLILGFIWYAKGETPKRVPEVDQLRIENKLLEVQSKGLQVKLSTLTIQYLELQLQVLRKEGQQLDAEYKELLTYLSSAVVAMVARNGLDTKKWTYDSGKKEFVPIPPSQ